MQFDHSANRFERGMFLAGIAAAALSPHLVSAADLKAVNVGMVPLDIDGDLSYAQDLGYYQSAGITVNLTMLSSGPAIVNAVVGGSLDIGAGNVGSVIIARSRGIPLKLIASSGMAVLTDKTEPISVLKDSTIRGGADLNGKTIGINAVKTMQHAAILLWIDKHGGDSKTVKFVEMPVSEMPAALQSRRVDAVLPGEPFTTAMKNYTRELGGQYSAMQQPFPIFAVFSTETWLAANHDAAAKFTSALQRAAAYSNTHHKETSPMLARLTKSDHAFPSTMGRITYGTSIDSKMLLPVIENLRRYGILDRPLDADELVWQA